MLNAMLKASFIVASIATFTGVPGCTSTGEYDAARVERIVTATTQRAGEVKPITDTIVTVTPPGSIVHEIAMGISALAAVVIALEQSSRRARANERVREAKDESIELAKQLPPTALPSTPKAET